MMFEVNEKDALVVVDVQKDFCPGGSLPVQDGDKVVPVLNDYIKMFLNAGAQIYATRDWHPPNHLSFKQYGGTWPPHCIKETEGAKFHSDLKLPKSAKIISKATTPNKEAYSGFDGTNLEKDMRIKGVRRVFVGGLATDYCVKNTVLDAIKAGFEAVLLTDATLGVNVKPSDSEKAVKEMIETGAKTATLAEIQEPISDLKKENVIEGIEEITLKNSERKKLSRLRTRGPYRKATLFHREE
jgi:nicotinamidase/pyrazinamidase